MAFEIARCYRTVMRSFWHVTYKNTMSLPRETHLALPRSKPSAHYYITGHMSSANDSDYFYFLLFFQNTLDIVYQLIVLKFLILILVCSIGTK